MSGCNWRAIASDCPTPDSDFVAYTSSHYCPSPIPVPYNSPRCEAVQNLRKAVASYKRQYETAETGSSKNERLGNLVFNYLYR